MGCSETCKCLVEMREREIDALKDELKQVREERDGLKVKWDAATDCVGVLNAENTLRMDENTRLRNERNVTLEREGTTSLENERLKGYAVHKPDCRYQYAITNPCTCGLTDLLERAK